MSHAASSPPVSQLAFRKACLDDLATLVALEETCFAEDGFSARQVRYLLTKAKALVLVAELAEGDGGASRVVGVAYYLLRRNSDVARLYGLVVDAACRGRGIASGLMDEGERRLGQQGYQMFSLEVKADDQATRRLYVKHGYVFQRDLPGYYAQGRAGVRMVKDLRALTGHNRKK